MSTVLGSCIAIVLWHPVKHCGGICHYMYTQQVSSETSLRNPDGKVAEYAFAKLLARIARRNERPSDYEAGIYGGVKPEGVAGRPIYCKLVDDNVGFAVAALQRAAVPIVHQHVKIPTLFLKVSFDMADGSVALSTSEI